MFPLVASGKYWFVISVWKIQGLLVLHFAMLNYTAVLLLAKKDTFHSSAEEDVSQGHAGDHISDIFCDN